LLHLRVTDIDSAHMVIQVRQGKGAKDRLVPLSLRLLEELRAYWCRCRPRTWLFPGHKADGTMTGSNIQRRFSRLVKQAGLNGRDSRTLPARQPHPQCATGQN
jgi:integrase/recombinase XerD